MISISRPKILIVGKAGTNLPTSSAIFAGIYVWNSCNNSAKASLASFCQLRVWPFFQYGDKISERLSTNFVICSMTSRTSSFSSPNIVFSM